MADLAVLKATAELAMEKADAGESLTNEEIALLAGGVADAEGFAQALFDAAIATGALGLEYTTWGKCPREFPPRESCPCSPACVHPETEKRDWVKPDHPPACKFLTGPAQETDDEKKEREAKEAALGMKAFVIPTPGVKGKGLPADPDAGYAPPPPPKMPEDAGARCDTPDGLPPAVGARPPADDGGVEAKPDVQPPQASTPDAEAGPSQAKREESAAEVIERTNREFREIEERRELWRQTHREELERAAARMTMYKFRDEVLDALERELVRRLGPEEARKRRYRAREQTIALAEQAFGLTLALARQNENVKRASPRLKASAILLRDEVAFHLKLNEFNLLRLKGAATLAEAYEVMRTAVDVDEDRLRTLRSGRKAKRAEPDDVYQRTWGRMLADDREFWEYVNAAARGVPESQYKASVLRAMAVFRDRSTPDWSQRTQDWVAAATEGLTGLQAGLIVGGLVASVVLSFGVTSAVAAGTVQWGALAATTAIAGANAALAAATDVYLQAVRTEMFTKEGSTLDLESTVKSALVGGVFGAVLAPAARAAAISKLARTAAAAAGTEGAEATAAAAVRAEASAAGVSAAERTGVAGKASVHGGGRAAAGAVGDDVALGIGAATEYPGPALTRLTRPADVAKMKASNVIRSSKGHVYAFEGPGPISKLRRSIAGLGPDDYVEVPIPRSAASGFESPLPSGPVNWARRAAGVRVAYGEVNLATGGFEASAYTFHAHLPEYVFVAADGALWSNAAIGTYAFVQYRD